MVSRDFTLFGREIGKAFVQVERAIHALDTRGEETSDEMQQLHDIYNTLHSMWTSEREKD